MKHETQNGWTKKLMKAQILRNMKGKSINAEGDCLYRSEFNGQPNACAVGCFIPDEKYSHSMENKTPYSVEWGPVSAGIAFPLNEIGLRAMQLVHDECDAAVDVARAVCRWIDENVEDAE